MKNIVFQVTWLPKKWVFLFDYWLSSQAGLEGWRWRTDRKQQRDTRVGGLVRLSRLSIMSYINNYLSYAIKRAEWLLLLVRSEVTRNNSITSNHKHKPHPLDETETGDWHAKSEKDCGTNWVETQIQYKNFSTV